MTPFALTIYTATFCLIAASWWLDVAKCKDFSGGGFWRWILSSFGLLLVSVSFALYIVMLSRLLRNPEVATHVDRAGFELVGTGQAIASDGNDVFPEFLWSVRRDVNDPLSLGF